MANPMMRNPRRRPIHDGGFTLLEVLVAFMIATPALVLLFGQGIQSIQSASIAGLYQQALSRATSRLDALLDQSLRGGEQSGDDGQGFHWRTRIVPIDTIRPMRAPAGGVFANGTTLFDVTVEVSWSGGSRGRLVALNTRRLGPASPSP